MDPISIITIVILSTVFVGSVIWLKKSIQRPASLERDLLAELNEKREKVAAIPFLNQQISELTSKENLLQVTLDKFREKNFTKRYRAHKT